MREILNHVRGRFARGAAGFDDVNTVKGAVVAGVHEAGGVELDERERRG
jgi:hypothetical protein